MAAVRRSTTRPRAPPGGPAGRAAADGARTHGLGDVGGQPQHGGRARREHLVQPSVPDPNRPVARTGSERPARYPPVPGMADSTPFVRVVVINFDGWQMTIDCLRSILATDWPTDRLEVVMVDNGSVDDVVERVRVELPAGPHHRAAGQHRLRRRVQPRHPGAGQRSISSRSSTTTPRSRPAGCGRSSTCWTGGPTVGAACPKILFDERFVEAALDRCRCAHRSRRTRARSGCG